MKKVELLSPAGSYESALAAIQNGCDAIYMAGSHFGARAFAANFDDQKIIEMVKYAHAYGVKIYITLNTLIHDEECESCFEYIKFLYDAKVDALIIQDLGILSFVRSHYPDFEVHASTQMHVVNKFALSFLKAIGVSRAVLAREVKLAEIEQFAKQGIELEVFVHGALCVSYSGQCLMSSMIGGRSGNRGECAQTCRMPYTLTDFYTNKDYGKTGYLLSLMDLNTLDHVNALKEAGVTSFKIEGRMKKSEYVAHITSLYRKKINDDHYQVSKQDIETAKVLFHRGYTSGFLMSQMGTKLYNPNRPNHIGISIGKVVAYKKGNVLIQLIQPVNQGDGIRILMDKKDYGFKVNRLYVDGLLENHANAGICVAIECHEKVEVGSLVVKTSDPIVEKQIQKSYEQKQRSVMITMHIIAKSNQKLVLRVSDGLHEVCQYSQDELELANNRATTEADIMKQLKKVNDTIFDIEAITIDMQEALFIPIKIINQLRRDALDALYAVRSNEIERKSRLFSLRETPFFERKQELNAKVLNEEQLLICLNYVDYVYVSDRNLYEKYKTNTKVKLCSSRVEKQSYENVTMIQEIGGINELEKFECDTSLNVYNAYTLNFLQRMGAEMITFSYELSITDIKKMMKQYKERYLQSVNTQFVAYGRVEVMVSEHCPINASLLNNDKKQCQLCRHQTYALKDKFNNKLPMHNDEQCRMHLFDFKIMDRMDKIKEILAADVKAIRLDFTFEKGEEIESILMKAKQFMK